MHAAEVVEGEPQRVSGFPEDRSFNPARTGEGCRGSSASRRRGEGSFSRAYVLGYDVAPLTGLGEHVGQSVCTSHSAALYLMNTHFLLMHRGRA